MITKVKVLNQLGVVSCFKQLTSQECVPASSVNLGQDCDTTYF